MDNVETRQVQHQLPALPYDVAALEPHIDARTMTLHHDKHHATYVEKLNAALKKCPGFETHSAIWLLLNLERVPEQIRTEVANNAGGHVNHSMFWRAMTPGGRDEPGGALADALQRGFGGVEKFKAAFDEAGAKVFGSGWVWLARTEKNGGQLEILTTTGHKNPLMEGHFPLLLNDVWEHAYYLKHENRRPEYLKGWWSVVDWKEVAHRFEVSAYAPERRWENDGGLVLQGPK